MEDRLLADELRELDEDGRREVDDDFLLDNFFTPGRRVVFFAADLRAVGRRELFFAADDFRAPPEDFRPADFFVPLLRAERFALPFRLEDFLAAMVYGSCC